MPYHTRQQAVLRCLEQRREESLSAAELAEELRRLGCAVGLATIYRQLEKLAAVGQIHWIDTSEGTFCQLCGHAGGSHRDCFLLKCSRCGRIRHLDCSHLKALYDHLERDHHFRIDPRGTLFTGLCELCVREKDSHGTD